MQDRKIFPDTLQVKSGMYFFNDLVRSIIVVAQMAEKNVVPMAVGMGCQELRRNMICQMSVGRQYALFQIYGIRSFHQHLLAVIRLYYYIVGF